MLPIEAPTEHSREVPATACSAGGGDLSAQAGPVLPNIPMTTAPFCGQPTFYGCNPATAAFNCNVTLRNCPPATTALTCGQPTFWRCPPTTAPTCGVPIFHISTPTTAIIYK